jgi:hypothetical protein
MNDLIWLASLVGILCTAVICGTDIFFLTVGRPALRLASSSAGTEVMGFFHSFGDARMPIWGVLAILSNFLLALFSRTGHRGFHFASLCMLVLFVFLYNRLSKPINRLQTEAAKTGRVLDNARELQASWDRSVMIRTPLLVAALIAQCLASLGTGRKCARMLVFQEQRGRARRRLRLHGLRRGVRTFLDSVTNPE